MEIKTPIEIIGLILVAVVFLIGALHIATLLAMIIHKTLCEWIKATNYTASFLLFMMRRSFRREMKQCIEQLEQHKELQNRKPVNFTQETEPKETKK